MAHVTVTINGRNYRMACEDGQEKHLVKLAEDFERRIQELRGSFGEIGDSRLVVMAALTFGDDLADSSRKVRELEEEIARLRESRVAAADHGKATEAAVSAALNAAAERIERVAKGLNQSLGNGVAMG
jgi:cell division protein ZapA